MTLSAMALASVAAIPSAARADNPIVQTFYTADPAPMVHEGTLYLYTSHDEDVSVNNFYTMNDWRLYSTTDMVNWRDHGSVASYRSFSWGTGDAWAPQGIARNGKYYLYVPLNNATGAKIGVGVSDNVAGPFMDPLGKELVVAPGGGNIDPTVFIDDDGQAHMYWGNGTLRHVKLNSDMISTSGSITTVPLNGFTEGPWLSKRGSLYYLVYAAISGTEKISYATSNSPTGPWTIRGDIMDAGRTYTNHAGIVDYKGHSYFFYHNSALPGGGDFKRSVCVEEFTYGADGSIPKIRMSESGPAAVDTLNPFTQVEAETIAFSSGLKTEVCTDTGGGMNVSSISNGDYIKVKDVDFLDGVTSFEARVSSAASDAKIELRLDSQNGTLLGTCDVSGASSWTTKTCEVSGGSGKHDLFLKFVGGGGDLFKFNWWRFTGPTMPGGGDGGGGGGDGGSGQGAGGSGGGGGTGGSASAGGTTSGSGGSVTGGTGGTTGTDGSGSGGNAGSSDGDDAAGGDSCACRAGASAGNGGLAAALWLVGSALVLRRRRR
ncbi:glycoside hydrolase family 43 protein [Sorangium sp. So ce854]|uniref:glycoside hydrolase family 43 protein n=1 Tax=Sorangium sp. So ce854 TaxID=3133322 RepID=UPI003F60E2C7